MTIYTVRSFAVIALAAILVPAGCSREAPLQTSAATRAAAPASPPSKLAPAKPAAKEAVAAKPSEGPAIVPISEIYTLPAADEEGEKLTTEEIQVFLDDPRNHEPIVPETPFGLTEAASQIPADNAMTRAKAELGRQLYFDKRLSIDNSIACATCHDPAKGWAEHTAVSTGVGGQKGGRNAPTIMNRIYGKTQFWDGRAATMEEQALGPIQNPIEMGMKITDEHAPAKSNKDVDLAQQLASQELLERLGAIEGYSMQFEKVFGEISDDAIASAIATFERTVIVGGAPYDYQVPLLKYANLTREDYDADPDLAALRDREFQAAAAHPMSESAKRGQELFFKKAACSLCHVGINFSDEAFYNIGVGMQAEEPDVSRFAVTQMPADTGAFKVPTLRNIVLNPPYMHDGSQKTLAEVVKFYNEGGHANPHLHERIKKLNLTDQEMADVVAFMEEGLSSPLPEIPAPRLP